MCFLQSCKLGTGTLIATGVAGVDRANAVVVTTSFDRAAAMSADEFYIQYPYRVITDVLPFVH